VFEYLTAYGRVKLDDCNGKGGKKTATETKRKFFCTDIGNNNNI